MNDAEATACNSNLGLKNGWFLKFKISSGEVSGYKYEYMTLVMNQIIAVKVSSFTASSKSKLAELFATLGSDQSYIICSFWNNMLKHSNWTERELYEIEFESIAVSL